jgi:thymidylate synthase
MKAYLDIVQNILLKGRWKGNRTGIRTLTCANQVFSHNMADGFPLLTTKKMPIKTIATELQGFIAGITDKKWYQERNCHIWDEWANPMAVNKQMCVEENQFLKAYPNSDIKEAISFADKNKQIIQKEVKDLGPIYGYQWRRFNQVYDENDEGCIIQYDQLKGIVDTLHKNPDDRRMVCSAWNPIQMSRMALPPCHFAWDLTHIDGILNLCWIQRSCDLMLGVPFNIASYALLLELLCKEANMTPGNLTGILCDCHIYEDHIDTAREQLKRRPKELPDLGIFNHSPEPFDIFKWVANDIIIENYNPWPKLEMKVAI